MVREFTCALVAVLFLLHTTALATETSPSEALGRIPDRVWEDMVRANVERIESGEAESLRPELHRRIGLVLGAPAPQGEYRIVDLKVSESHGLGCAGGTLFGELRAMLDLQNLAHALEGLITGLVSEAPLLLLCYYSPTMCSYVKHVRNMLNMGLQIRMGQCAALNRFVDQRIKDFQAKQLDECVKLRGNTTQAMAECREELASNPLLGLPLDENGEFRLGERFLTHVFTAEGMDEGEAKEKARTLTAIFGDVVFTAREGGARKSTGGSLRRNVSDLYRAAYLDYRRAVEEVLASARAGGGRPSPEAVEGLVSSVVYVTPAEVAQVYRWLGEEAARGMLMRLAEIDARLRIRSMLVEALDTYSKALEKTQVQSNRDSLRRIIEQLRSLQAEYGATPADLRREANRMVASLVAEANARAGQDASKDAVQWVWSSAMPASRGASFGPMGR
jgi:hypothetical protein